MTKKERLLNAIQLKTVDKIPLMYRGIPCFTKSLMKYFNIGDQSDPDIIIKNYKNLLSKLNADYWTLGSAPYFSNFVPRYIGSYGEYNYIDHDYYALFGIEHTKVTIEKYGYSYISVSKNPLIDCEDYRKVRGILTKKLDLFDYKNSINYLLNNGKFSDYYNSTYAKKVLDYINMKNEDTVISMGNVAVNPFIICCCLRGMTNFLMDLVGNKKMAEAIINEVKEYVLEFNKRSLNNTIIKPDVFAAWDDVCMQSSEMFSVDIFKKYFLPIWKELIYIVKSKNLYFCWHCCGNVNNILPIMIDAGIDIYDVLQTSAKDMELDKFYKKFGRDVAIQGGIDVQRLLINGTPLDIRNEVKKIEKLWRLFGGIILGPSHEILPETKIINAIAIYE